MISNKWAGRVLVGFVVSFAFFSIPSPQSRAELPPGSYNSLRVDASEALVIEVTAVKTKEGEKGKVDVTLEAKVIKVERSKAGLKKGDAIVIAYTHIDTTKLPGFTGPRQVPILEKGEFYPAFLAKEGDTKTFKPAAYGESFRMTPEK